MIVYSQHTPGERVLFHRIGLNMGVTTDSGLNRAGRPFVKCKITRIMAKYYSGSVSGSPAGGIYTAASKGGTAIVAAGQSWANLTAAGKIVVATLNAVVDTDEFQAANNPPFLYFSLTTANGGGTGSLRAHVMVMGYATEV